MPLVRRAAPAVALELDGDHDDVEEKHAELDALIEALTIAEAGVRQALGRELASRVHGLIAHHLRHMDREERRANAALWSRFSDAELAGVHGRIMATLEPEERAEAIQLMLASVSAPEREVLLATSP